MENTEITSEDIVQLRLEGKYEDADALIRQFHDQSVRNQVRPPRSRKMSLSVSIAIDDVIFMDSKGLKASELLHEKIEEIKNGKSD